MRVAIYKCGSSLILNNPNDDDLVYYYNSDYERKEALAKNRERDKDIKFRLVSEATKVFIGCWAYPLMELVEGDEIKKLKDFDLKDHKEEYIALVKKYVEWLPKTDKRWYHILIGVYMLKNGKMKLTKTQLEYVQKTHNEGISDKLYANIIDYLGK